MDVPETKLVSPEKFPFPFVPYSIQEDLMRKLYETLEEKKFGIFESPTGTGKSMSLICGSLKWLLDAEQRIKKDVESKIQEMNTELKKFSLGENWLEEHSIKAKTQRVRDSLQDFLNKIIKMENKIMEIQLKAQQLTEKSSKSNPLKFLKLEENYDLNSVKNNSDNSTESTDDNDLLLEDFDSSDEKKYNSEKYNSELEMENEENYNGIKIFLCSRTHSQLTQLVREIQKSPFKDLQIRVISLASRLNYCINNSVSSLKHLSLINEKCQDLLDGKNCKITKKSKNDESLKKQKTSRGCPFNKKVNIENLKVKALTEIQDVENLVKWGKHFNACPYYASRSAIDEAQVVLVPYNTILHKDTREACGIDIKNSIVIIDEAHNLLDAIGNFHSCSVSGVDLISSQKQLINYKEKYGERFTPANLLCFNQFLFIIGRLIKKLNITNNANNKNEVVIETLVEFITSCEIDTINFYKILDFITRSKIVIKLRGFTRRYGVSLVDKKPEEKGVAAFLKKLKTKEEVKPDADEADENSAINGNPLLNVVGFLRSLTNHCHEGRILSTRSQAMTASSLKYLLLNPASQFSDIVSEARAVVLAGGTMQPFSEFTDQLFYLAGASRDRISTFSCGHIISKDNILPIILSNGPTGKTFDFSFKHRNNTETLDELGRLLVNVCNIVPKGIVCFFPSYEYKNVALERWEKTKVVERMQKRKKVVIEPKNSNELDKVLKTYSEAVKETGALLFSVVGGKLSEGLNFNDDLGRCVIVVGLPFPNSNNPELKEKINYLNSEVGSGTGKVYYENLCMKAVNQSIGRSVRHKNDYASVLLVDNRYARPECIKALPEWIRRSLRNETKFGIVVGLLAKFFASKKIQT